MTGLMILNRPTSHRQFSDNPSFIGIYIRRRLRRGLLLLDQERKLKYAFIIWAELAVAVLIIDGNSSRNIIELASIVSPAVQSASRAFGTVWYVIAALGVKESVLMYW